MNNKVLYSIIIPHYNSYNLLRRTLDSIPIRGDIQILVIDDVSSESSIFSISKESNYSHVDFIFSENKVNAGGARNIGLDQAQGKYVLFSDSDDYFTKEAFNIFDQYTGYNYDLVQFKVTSFLEGKSQTGTRHSYLKEVYKKKGLSLYLSIDQPYGKLIKRDLIEKYKIRFSKVPAGNDIYFSAKISLFSKKRLFVKEISYAISQNTTSITATKTDRNNCARAKEQIKKVILIRSVTPIWFWYIYLCRRNAFTLTRQHINKNKLCSPEFKGLSKEYQKVMPKFALVIYNIFIFFTQK
jgi:glycosyltransferase involved in cell wall biosynthesis